MTAVVGGAVKSAGCCAAAAFCRATGAVAFAPGTGRPVFPYAARLDGSAEPGETAAAALFEKTGIPVPAESFEYAGCCVPSARSDCGQCSLYIAEIPPQLQSRYVQRNGSGPRWLQIREAFRLLSEADPPDAETHYLLTLLSAKI